MADPVSIVAAGIAAASCGVAIWQAHSARTSAGTANAAATRSAEAAEESNRLQSEGLRLQRAERQARAGQLSVYQRGRAGFTVVNETGQSLGTVVVDCGGMANSPALFKHCTPNTSRDFSLRSDAHQFTDVLLEWGGPEGVREHQTVKAIDIWDHLGT